MFKAKIIIGAVFSLIVADLLTQVIRYYFYNPHLEYTPAKSVTMAGYSPQRTGIIHNDLPLSNHYGIIKKSFTIAKNANEGMPLFINTADLSKSLQSQMPTLKSQYLIFTTKDGKIVSYDLIQDKIFWSIKVDWNLALSAPAISLSKGRIYLRNYEYYFSIKFDGSDLQKIPLDLKKIIIKNAKLPTNDSHRYDGLDCTRTSLGINEQNSPAYIFQGCSYGMSYGLYKGATGHLFAIYLDKDGRITNPVKYNFYNPSVSTPNPKTGFNTGLWNTGMGPTLTDNNKLLLATGNGPVIPEEKNYGCSIIKVDGKKLKIKDWKQFYSMDYKGYNECFHTNIELGSSSVAYKRVNGKEYGVITGKDGYLRVFDPNNLPQNDPKKMHEIKFSNNTFGQPLIYSHNNLLHVVVHGRRNEPNYSRQDFFLATDAIIDKIKKEKLFDGEIKKVKCLGYLQKKGQSKNRVNLFYSGRMRRDFVALRNNSKITSSLLNSKLLERYKIDWYFQSPYKKVVEEPLGFSTPNPPKGLEVVPMDFSMIIPQGHPNLDLYAKTSHFSSPKKMPFHTSYKDTKVSRNGFLLITKNRKNNFCDLKKHHDLNEVNIYQVLSKSYSDITSWTLNAFQITPNLKIKEIWHNIYNDGSHAMNSNIAAFEHDGDGIIAVVAGHVGQMDHSVLHLVSLKTGKLLHKYLFQGRVHFTMPLMIGNKIFIATMNHGIQYFILKFWSFKKFFWQHSFLFGGII